MDVFFFSIIAFIVNLIHSFAKNFQEKFCPIGSRLLIVDGCPKSNYLPHLERPRGYLSRCKSKNALLCNLIHLHIVIHDVDIIEIF